jgi:filamentous hemagglutinin
VAADSALAAEALELGLSEGVVPELHYVDPVSGDYLPFYYNAESGQFQPYWNQPMQMGNVFNELGNWGYPVHELPLRTAVPSGAGSTVRLDSYDPVAGEIISRKYTQLGGIDQFDALGYVQELVIKYPSGAEIAATPATRAAGLAGNSVEGQLVLEVPVQKDPIPEHVLRYAESRGVIIRDPTGHIYRPET